MEGISGVVARIGTLQAQMASLSGTPTAAPAPAASTTGGTFADALAKAVATQEAVDVPGAGTTVDGATPLATSQGTGFSADLGTALARALERAATPSAAAPVEAASTASVARASAPTAPAAPVSTELTSRGVPVALEHYGNGRVPTSQLQSIGDGERLWAPAAQAFTRLRAAAARDGVSMGVNDSYRSYDQQVDMAERKGLRSQGGLAAQPGTSSHGWGMALDLQLDGKALSWMRSHADEYGFAETVSGEPWHWGYKP